MMCSVFLAARLDKAWDKTKRNARNTNSVAGIATLDANQDKVKKSKTRKVDTGLNFSLSRTPF